MSEINNQSNIDNMKASEIINQLVETANINKTSNESRVVVSFSVCRAGASVDASPDQLAERMRASVVRASGSDDCVLGMQHGFRVDEDENVIHYAIGEFYGSKIVKLL